MTSAITACCVKSRPWGGKCGNGRRVISWEAVIKIQRFGPLVEMGKKWSDDECILKVEPKGFAVRERY